MLTETEIEEKLYALGRTPSKVANSLIALGIKGIRCRTTSCPISQFIRSKIYKPADNVTVSINENYIDITGDGILTSLSLQGQFTIKSFIANFDAGFYPQLEMNMGCLVNKKNRNFLG